MESNNFLDWAKNEIQLAGLNDEDADYGGALGKAVTELVETFSKQHHSGHSAMMVAAIFYRLTQYRPLTDLTNDPDEWQEVTDVMFTTEQRLAGEQIWQSRRSPSVFSRDGGKTWEDMETKEKGTSLSKEEFDGVKHSNKQEQEASSSSGSGKGSEQSNPGKGLQKESSTQPVPAESSSSEQESGSVARDERTLEGSEPTDRNQPPESGTQSRKKGKASGKKGGKA